MLVTPEQEAIGKDNFNEVVSLTRRDFIKGAAAAGTGLGALYFGYEKLKGDPVKVAFIGTGDEGNVLISEHFKIPLTTIRQPKLRLGSEAMDLMRSLLQGEIPLSRRLHSELLIRDSTAPPPKGR